MNIIGVRFRTAGKVYYFDPASLEPKRGDHVIVETARGIEYGTVVRGLTDVPEEKVTQPLRAVVRLANEQDEATYRSNREKEVTARGICIEKIRKHGLEMKLIDVEYTFDGNKILFYFTADGRVDFRDLVKDLASVFHTRIELRQIGVRDETKIIGGCGVCGRPLCCHSYLEDFIPVSIRMAKEQNLSLNPGKISGVCGRLMCCLKYEEDTYEELNAKLPRVGDVVTAQDGAEGRVQSVNILRQIVRVVVETGDDEREIRDYPVDELVFRPRRRGGEKKNADAETPRGQEKQGGDSRRREGRKERREKPEGEAAPEAGQRGENKNRENHRRRRRDGDQGGRREDREGRGGRQERGNDSGRNAGKGGDPASRRPENAAPAPQRDAE
ncbi:MAG: stage 0 sporulation protein [Lachnospiraceae bacterium]|nr:stage 0 sporulation protein [Lachnospiraceae bacterium]